MNNSINNGLNPNLEEPKNCINSLNNLINDQKEMGELSQTFKGMKEIIQSLEKRLIKMDTVQEFESNMSPLLQALESHAEAYYDSLHEALVNNERIGPKEYLSLEMPLKIYSLCNKLANLLKKYSN